MGYDLQVVATRKIKYEDPKTKQWLDDVQRYTLHTPDFNSEDNVSVVESDAPYHTYCRLVYQYWADDNLKAQIRVVETIQHLDQQIKKATDEGYTIDWQGG